MQTYYFVFLAPDAPVEPVKEAVMLGGAGDWPYLICTEVRDSWMGMIACHIKARDGVPDDLFHLHASHVRCIVEMPKGRHPVGFGSPSS